MSEKKEQVVKWKPQPKQEVACGVIQVVVKYMNGTDKTMLSM